MLDEDKYLKAAADCADFLTGRLTDGDGRLLARWREEPRRHSRQAGRLRLLRLGPFGALRRHLPHGIPGRGRAAGRAAAGLLFSTGRTAASTPIPATANSSSPGKEESYDGALPSGNAVAALVLSRLARLTGELRWRTAADLQLRWLAGAAEDYPAGHSFALLTLLEELWPSAELVCAAGAVPEALRRFLRRSPGPASRCW